MLSSDLKHSVVSLDRVQVYRVTVRQEGSTDMRQDHTFDVGVARPLQGGDSYIAYIVEDNGLDLIVPGTYTWLRIHGILAAQGLIGDVSNG